MGRDAVPGAVAACQMLLQQPNLKVLFLTNTSKLSSAALLRQLRDVGFDESAVPGDAIMTSVGATRRYLVENELRPCCLVEDELLKTDFEGLDARNPNCVLVGLAPSKFDYERLNGAFRLLTRLKEGRVGNDSDAEGAKPLLVAIHRAAHYRDSDHGLSLGPGGFVSLLEQTVGVKARVVGKPSRDFYRAALASLGIDNPSHAVMVGDDVVGDIKGALDAGLGGAILVKTGRYVGGDESGLKTGGGVPTLTVDSIVEAVDHIICSASE